MLRHRARTAAFQVCRPLALQRRRRHALRRSPRRLRPSGQRRRLTHQLVGRAPAIVTDTPSGLERECDLRSHPRNLQHPNSFTAAHVAFDRSGRISGLHPLRREAQSAIVDGALCVVGVNAVCDADVCHPALAKMVAVDANSAQCPRAPSFVGLAFHLRDFRADFSEACHTSLRFDVSCHMAGYWNRANRSRASRKTIARRRRGCTPRIGPIQAIIHSHAKAPTFGVGAGCFGVGRGIRTLDSRCHRPEFYH